MGKIIGAGKLNSRIPHSGWKKEKNGPVKVLVKDGMALSKEGAALLASKQLKKQIHPFEPH